MLEKGAFQVCDGVGMHGLASAKQHHDGAAIIRDDTQVPEQDVQIGIIAIAEKRFGMRLYHIRVQVFQELELVIPANRANDGFDLRIGKSGVNIARPLLKWRVHLARGGIFDGDQVKDVTQAVQTLFKHSREDLGQAA
jgi:hypothetical protein